MRKALFVGINDYPHLTPLRGCVNDATQMSHTLARHAGGQPNFQARLLTTGEDDVDHALLEARLQELFSGECDTALFYFAGHGHFDDSLEEGLLLPQNARSGRDGIRFSDILNWARNATGIRDKILILDCCQAGAAGEARSLRGGDSQISEGLTIMTACRRPEAASESGPHGVFTSLLIQGLNGGASSVLGDVTPGGLYAFVDNALGAWEQRPVFKTNVSRFIALRENEPLVPRDVLRKLPQWFPEPEGIYPLDPSYEPTAPEFDAANGEVFAQLQRCNRHSLIEPVDADHMYFAAMNGSGCRLTALGAYYRILALKEHF